MPIPKPREIETAADSVAVSSRSQLGLAVRWAIVLLPGFLLYYLPLPFLNLVQHHLLAIFAATSSLWLHSRLRWALAQLRRLLSLP